VLLRDEWVMAFILLQSFSAIVGPNGSGKSNVIDAMLFVFGKRAKQVGVIASHECSYVMIINTLIHLLSLVDFKLFQEISFVIVHPTGRCCVCQSKLPH
jgi:AAA15 family ATPase/GTPase